MKEKGKHFFFEKRKQKTSAPCGPWQRLRVQKFFAELFFKKATALLCLFFASFAYADNCGTLVIPTGVGVSSSADVTSLNPLMVTSLYNQQAANLMYLNLLWINGNTGQIDWSRSLASSVTMRDNGATYVVTLRPWHWSDGTPITSADVAYTYSLILALGTNYVGYGAGGMPAIIKSLTLISPSQFKVVLTHPVNSTWYIYNGLNQLLPLPKHSWAKYSVDQIFQNQSDPAFFNVIDGPLFAQKLAIGLDLIMVPNSTFKGPPVHFTRLIFKFLESDGAAVQGVESGDLDMADVPDAIFGAVQHLPGINVVTLPPDNSFNETQLNYRNPAVAFFRDVRVRDAMADAIDQQGMVKLIDHGYGVTIWGPVPTNEKAFLSPEMLAGHYPVGYDPEKSRALLKQAGFTPGPDGIMQMHGRRLSFTYLMLSDDALIEQIAEVMQADLRKVGIEMKVREIEFNQMLAILDHPTSAWDAAGLAETIGGYPSGEDLFATGGYLNSGGYSDSEMDTLIAASNNTPGLTGLYAYENYASAQQPVLFLEREGVSVLVHDNIQGMRNFVDADDQYYPDALTCRAEKEASR